MSFLFDYYLSYRFNLQSLPHFIRNEPNSNTSCLKPTWRPILIMDSAAVRLVKPSKRVRLYTSSCSLLRNCQSGSEGRCWPASIGFVSARGSPLRETSEKASQAGSSVSWNWVVTSAQGEILPQSVRNEQRNGTITAQFNESKAAHHCRGVSTLHCRSCS